MWRRLRGVVRSLFVVVGIIVLTSFSIDATDALRGSESALGWLVRDLRSGQCPADMVMVEGVSQHRLCVDRYEAGVSPACRYIRPQSALETAENINDPDCAPESAAEVLPWTHVMQVQAEQLCARVGKRLLSAGEWFLAAAGTPDNDEVCALTTTLSRTGSNEQCHSGAGAYDMVGNVWEWVGDEVSYGSVGETVLPASGFVAAVGTGGLPSVTSSTPSGVFNNDYVWTTEEGVQALMRGGFYGSRGDGGIYALHAAVAPQFSSASVGFRCARSL